MRDTPAQIVIVDNNENHLRAIVDTFHNEGIACLGLHYDSQVGLNADHFRGVRLLFCDLHLIETATFGREHYGHMAQLLSDNASPDGGPFVLILWTDYDQQVNELIDYLDETTELPPHARPIAVGRLAKDKFLDPEERTVHDPDGLMAEIENAINMAPQLSALFSWEQDVQTATRSTLASVINLVPETDRTSDRFPTEVDIVLSRLAIAAVGDQNVSKDPRAALNACLAPILADCIAGQSMVHDVGLWQRAITHGEVPPLPPAQSGLVNRMLHIALPHTGTILPTDWGAFVEFPLNWDDDDAVKSRFGLTGGELLGSHFKVQPDHYPDCRPGLLRIGAPCDYAQNKSGPVTYLLTLEVPHTVRFTGKSPGAIWESPCLSLDGVAAHRLLASSMFPWTTNPSDTACWRVLYRVREQLLMQLVHSFGMYSTRPGCIVVPWEPPSPVVRRT